MALLGWAVQHGLTERFDAAGLRALSGVDAAPAWRAVSRLGDSHVRLAIAAAAIIGLLSASVPNSPQHSPSSAEEKGGPATSSGRTGKARALGLAVLVLGGMALNGLAKAIASRPRPGLLPHLDLVAGYSFPSGHSAGTAVLALGLALFAAPKGRRVPAMMLAVGLLLLVGLSRIALAVHWPSDVLAGWMEGTGWVLLVRAGFGKRHG